MKKFLLGILTFLIILVAAFLGWYFLSRGESTGPIVQTIKNVLPFGSSGNDAGDTTNPLEHPSAFATTTSDTTTDDNKIESRENLFSLTNTPIAGAVVFSRNKLEMVRYVDRATGHIFEIVLPSATSTEILERKLVSNKTLPKIYEAYFRADGNAVLLRSLKDNSDVVENMTLTLTPPKKGTTSTDELWSISATMMRGDIGSVIVGTGNTLIYTLKDSGTIATSPFDSLSSKVFLNLPFTDWRLAGSGNNLVVYPKASAEAPGLAYKLASGSLTKLVGPFNGLVAIPNPSSTRTLYSYVSGGETKLFVINKGSVSEISPATIAEKCIWSNKNQSVVICGVPMEIDGLEPDNWYKGLAHFSDRLWLFDTDSEVAQVLVEPKTKLGIDLDLINPQLSPQEDYLIFTNKNDLSLWAFKL